MVLECISLLFTCRVNLLPPVSFLSGNFSKLFVLWPNHFLQIFLPTPPPPFRMYEQFTFLPQCHQKALLYFIELLIRRTIHIIICSPGEDHAVTPPPLQITTEINLNNHKSVNDWLCAVKWVVVYTGVAVLVVCCHRVVIPTSSPHPLPLVSPIEINQCKDIAAVMF